MTKKNQEQHGGDVSGTVVTKNTPQPLDSGNTIN